MNKLAVFFPGIGYTVDAELQTDARNMQMIMKETEVFIIGWGLKRQIRMPVSFSHAR